MKVNVSFQFDSPEEAVQFLGRKVLGVQDAPKQPEAPKPAEKRGRGRPPKKAEAPAPSLSSVANQGAIPAEAPTASAPTPAAPAANTPPAAGAQSPAAAVPSDADVTAALQAVLKATSMNKVTAIFARYGVQRGREVKGEDRAGFIAYCAKVASKDIDPEKGNGVVS